MMNSIKQYEKTIDRIIEIKEATHEKWNNAIAEGKWSIMQIVGHIYYWDKYILEIVIPQLQDGADLPPFPDHDLYNEEAMNFIRDFSNEHLVNAFVKTRKDLVEELSKIDQDVRFTINGSKRRYSTDSFIRMFLEHDEHHLKQIQEFSQKK
ncbi:DinB family protein [Bacillus sp. THAF10]|uniref:DinB family protein n=1 Tax=Bacillus sp. THAF10 TaxID=2587848 RepID=UPI0020A64440|nr:DinB family protein [Bacillus sp. THAF10]